MNSGLITSVKLGASLCQLPQFPLKCDHRLGPKHSQANYEPKLLGSVILNSLRKVETSDYDDQFSVAILV